MLIKISILFLSNNQEYDEAFSGWYGLYLVHCNINIGCNVPLGTI